MYGKPNFTLCIEDATEVAPGDREIRSCLDRLEIACLESKLKVVNWKVRDSYRDAPRIARPLLAAPQLSKGAWWIFVLVLVYFPNLSLEKVPHLIGHRKILSCLTVFLRTSHNLQRLRRNKNSWDLPTSATSFNPTIRMHSERKWKNVKKYLLQILNIYFWQRI